jgi:hypothetical protein
VYINHVFLIHSSVVGHLDCFRGLDVVNRAARNMGVQVALSDPGAYFFRYMLKNCVAGSCGRFIF